MVYGLPENLFAEMTNASVGRHQIDWATVGFCRESSTKKFYHSFHDFNDYNMLRHVSIHDGSKADEGTKRREEFSRWDMGSTWQRRLL